MGKIVWRTIAWVLFVIVLTASVGLVLTFFEVCKADFDRFEALLENVLLKCDEGYVPSKTVSKYLESESKLVTLLEEHLGLRYQLLKLAIGLKSGSLFDTLSQIKWVMEVSYIENDKKIVGLRKKYKASRSLIEKGVSGKCVQKEAVVGYSKEVSEYLNELFESQMSDMTLRTISKMEVFDLSEREKRDSLVKELKRNLEEVSFWSSRFKEYGDRVVRR